MRLRRSGDAHRSRRGARPGRLHPPARGICFNCRESLLSYNIFFIFVPDRARWANYTEPVALTLIVLAMLAGAELLIRYAARRTGTERRHGRITRFSLRLVTALSLVFLVALPSFRHETMIVREEWLQTIGKLGWFNEVSFKVTAIKPNAACDDPYRPRNRNEQFLRFDLETWSTVDDQFGDPATASGLTLHHWSIEDKYGYGHDNLYMYTKCGDGREAISQPIVPGAHTKTVVVVNAPKSAAYLVLDIPAYYGRWYWRIRPPSE